MGFRFDGKRALVTGAGKGIGKTVALKLAEAGANVIAVSRTQSDLDALKIANPEKIETLYLDIGEWAATREALKNIGPVDLLVNNAAIAVIVDLGSITKEQVDSVFDTNFKAVINITQMIAEGMKSRGKGGSIVNISSILSQFAQPGYSLYSGSKGALNLLTKTMAVEYGPYNIRVNEVCPTVVRTRMTEEHGYFVPNNEYAELLKKRTPLPVSPEVEDLIGPIFFLLSDYARLVTGIALTVDAGLTVCVSGTVPKPITQFTSPFEIKL